MCTHLEVDIRFKAEDKKPIVYNPRKDKKKTRRTGIQSELQKNKDVSQRNPITKKKKTHIQVSKIVHLVHTTKLSDLTVNQEAHMVEEENWLPWIFCLVHADKLWHIHSQKHW